MHRTKTSTRVLVAALAVAAIAAPASSARPIDLPAPPSQETPARSGSSLDPKGPVYWSYGYEASRPHQRSAGTDDGTPWAIVGLAVTGAALLAGGTLTMSLTRARARRARIAA